MDPLEYLKGLKRRWRFIAAVVAAAMLAGVGIGILIPEKSSDPVYKATTKLVNNTASAESANSGRTRQNEGSAGVAATDLTAASSLVTLSSVAISPPRARS